MIRWPLSLSFETLAWLSASLIIVSGCSTPDAGHVTWESLSEEEVVQRLGFPTGQLNAQIVPAQAMPIERSLPGMFEAAHYLGQVLTDLDELASQDQSEAEVELPATTTPENAEDDATWSTNIYLRLACPGEAIDPPFSFTHGELRLASPQFDGLTFSSFIDQGEFLMSFNHCDLGSVRFDAKLPGRYLATDSDLARSLFADPNLVPRHFIAVDLRQGNSGNLGIVALACGSATTSCRDDVLLAAEVLVPQLGTYVLWFRGTRSFWTDWSNHSYSRAVAIDVGLIGADGRASCGASYGADGVQLACDDTVPN